MGSVRISEKLARDLRDILTSLAGERELLPNERDARERLRAAMAPESKSKPPLKVAHKPRKPTKSQRKTAWEKVKAEVRLRSGGFCENCRAPFTDYSRSECDHYFGRGKGRPEASVQTCWGLCWHCHHAKTTNHPGQAEWAQRFAAHCDRYQHLLGYAEAKRKALSRGEWTTTRKTIGGRHG